MTESGPYLPGSVWTFGDVTALFFGGLVGSLVAIGIALAANGGEELATVPLLLVSSLGQAGVTLGLLAYMSRSRGAGSWALDFGFSFELADLRGIFFGMALQIAVIVVVLFRPPSCFK